jgi:hypothetical protein
MKSSDANEETANPSSGPSQNVRTIVSLLLFVHLFAVGMAVMTDGDFGTARAALLSNIKQQTPGLAPYLAQFCLDRGYDYHLMNDLPLDWDHRLVATVKYANGRADPPIVIPEPTTWPSERVQRDQQLARTVAVYATRASAGEAEEVDTRRKSQILEAIGGGLIRQHPGATSVALRCVYHQGISLTELDSEDTHERNPFDARYYGAAIDGNVVLDHDRPTFFENLPAAETSPARPRAEVKPKQGPLTSPASSSVPAQRAVEK